jgi:hypothetical protein
LTFNVAIESVAEINNQGDQLVINDSVESAEYQDALEE